MNRWTVYNDRYLLCFQVLDDYDCMLNQTNIGHNNNKFYIIQVLLQMGQYYTWTRWGRVVSTCVEDYQ